MRWAVVGRILPGLLAVANVLGHFIDQRFELVDALRLLVDDVVERLDQVFLVRQLDFDVDKTVFLTHDDSLLQIKTPL
jgi:hypothetical protein